MAAPAVSGSANGGPDQPFSPPILRPYFDGLLMTLKQWRDDTRRGHERVVERVDEMGFSIRILVAHVCPPCLPLVQGRTAVGLAVLFL